MQPGIDRIAHRTDVGRLLRAAVGGVGLRKVVGVQRVERRPDAVFGELLHLVLADELGMNCRDIPLLGQVARGCKLVRAQQRIDGGIAVGMDQDRHAEAVDLLEELVRLLLREAELALPVLLSGGTAGQIRSRKRRGTTLRRTVQRDLHAADFKTLVVATPGRDREGGQRLLKVRDEGIDDHVDQLRTAVAGALEDLELVEVGGAVLSRGDPVGGIQQLTRLARLDLLLGGHRVLFFHDRQERHFHDQAIRLLRARLADDHTARRCLGGGAVAVVLEGEAVQHRTVHRHVIHPDRIVGEGTVKVVAIQSAALRHHRVVVAIGHDHLPLRDPALRREGLQCSNDGRDVTARTRRRRIQVRLTGDQERVEEVAVPVKEARQQRLAGEVDNARRLSLVGLLDVGTRAERENPAITNRERFYRGLAVIDRDDVATDVDDIGDSGGRWRHGRRTARRIAARCGEQHAQERDAGRGRTSDRHGNSSFQR